MIPEPHLLRAPPLPAIARAQLEAIYQELDHDVQTLGVACWVRGDCCDFDRSDHRLFASTIEVAYVLEKHPEPFPAESRLCPFWRDGRCTERERRPLGCRTHFCDRRYRDQLEALHEVYYRRLRELAAAHGLEWIYGPFVAALRAADDAGAMRSATEAVTGP